MTIVNRKSISKKLLTVFATPCIFQTSPSNKIAVASLSTDGHFKIVDGSTGTTMFEKTLDKVFDKSDNEKLEQSENRKTRKEGKYFSSPVIVDDKVLIGCRDNFLYCFNVLAKS
jgi:hypothetical protein